MPIPQDFQSRHPRLQRSPITHHKRLMMHHIHELDGTAGTPSRLTLRKRSPAARHGEQASGKLSRQPPLHRFAELMHHKQLMMCAKSMEMNVRWKGLLSHSLPAVAGVRCSGEAPKQGRRSDRCPDLHPHGDVVTDDFLCWCHGIENCM